MHCPNCGKLLELKERNFCTGCGVDLDGVESKYEKRKKKSQSHSLRTGNPLPYGSRYISGDVSMQAYCKGLFLGAFFGFTIVFAGLSFVFLLHPGQAFGFGLLGMAPSGIFGLFIISKLSDKARAGLAGSLKFIPTSGPIFHIVDFMTMKLSFMNTQPKKPPAGQK